MKQLRAPVFAALALLSAGAGAQDSGAPPNLTETPPVLAPIVARLKPLHGKIVGESVTLHIPPDLSYLPPDQTEILLHLILRFPGKIANLGSVVPATVGIGSAASWATLITYRQDGHVSDDDAQALLDPVLLLERLKIENDAHNAELQKHGLSMFGTEIVGWVKPPHYDSAAHTLIWALEFAPRGQREHQYTYNIRILGRIGAISMVIDGKPEQLPMMEKGASELASAIQLNPTNRYEDVSWTDKTADYTLADIVAGDTNLHKTAPSHNKMKYLISLVLLAAVASLYRLKKKRRPPAA